MKALSILVAMLLISACARVPWEQHPGISFQQKMQATAHWKELAQKVAEEVRVAMNSLPTYQPAASSSAFGHASPPQISQQGPIFISIADQSPFGISMRSLLVTELINKGISVTEDENTTLKLGWEVQSVFHQAYRKNAQGLLSFVFVDIPQWIVFGETDWPNVEKPHSEIMITYQLTMDNRNILVRNNNIYYVNELDRNQYWSINGNQNAPDKTKELSAVSFTVTK